MNANCATIPQSQTIIALCALLRFLQTERVSIWNFRGWTRPNESSHSAHLNKDIWMIICYLKFPARPNYFLHMCECTMCTLYSTIALYSKTTFPKVKKYLRLIFLCCFRMKTLKLVFRHENIFWNTKYWSK